MVSKASEDFPDPDRPVMTQRRFRGMVTETFLRLCSRAPRTIRFSSAIALENTRGRPQPSTPPSVPPVPPASPASSASSALSAHPTVRPSDRPTVRPSDRPTVRPRYPFGRSHVTVQTDAGPLPFPSRMMCRSCHSRSSGRQEALGELFPASELEGDPLTRATDAAFPLRPFAAGIPLDGLGDAQAPPEESGPDRLLRHGRDAVHRGRRADALAAYADLLVAAPDHLDARLEYAALLEAAGEEARALEHLGEAVRRHGERPDALVARGAFQARRKEYTEAEADLHRAIKLFPSDPAPQFELGFALWRKGLAADAAVHLRQAATLAP